MLFNQLLDGAARGIRTPDPIITNDVRYWRESTRRPSEPSDDKPARFWPNVSTDTFSWIFGVAEGLGCLDNRVRYVPTLWRRLAMDQFPAAPHNVARRNRPRFALAASATSFPTNILGGTRSRKKISFGPRTIGGRVRDGSAEKNCIRDL
jgi:hypothetical protein